MKMVPLKLVTIIAEAVLEARLIREVRELGATGHTLSRVHGEGSRGVRASEWEGGNIRLETLVGDDLADRILQHIADNYFEHYAVVAFVTDAAVIRGDKYV
jgi:nitrogen regulatory protein P-II 2